MIASLPAEGRHRFEIWTTNLHAELEDHLVGYIWAVSMAQAQHQVARIGREGWSIWVAW